MLEFDSLRVHFGGVRAVDGVTGRLEAGRVLGLIGPNGSGKSTLLNAIAGVHRPTSGTLSFSGRVVAGWSPQHAARHGVGRVFQTPQSMPELTVLENTEIGAIFGRRGVSRHEARRSALQSLDAVGLSAQSSQRASQLTLAQRKGLELARLMTSAPRLALVDELLAGLSPNESVHMQGILRAMREDGVAMVLVEHVPGVVAALADEICVLHHGRVLAWGPPQEVLDDADVADAYLGRRHG